MRRWSKTTIAMVLALVIAACAPATEDPAAELPSPEEAAAQDATDAPPEPDVPDADESADDEAHEPVAEAPSEAVTAYVVSYHWGWAVFDEDGTELDVLEVPVGTEVELYAVNDHARGAIDHLPDEVAEAIHAVDWHERAHHAVMEGRIPDPQDEIGMSMSEALTAAHDGHDHMGAAQDHGLMVTGVGVQVFLDAHAHEPERLVFTVDREGVFEFRCTEDCGFGHDYQRWEMLIVA